VPFSAAECRRFAEACIDMAEHARSVEKRCLLQLAEAWLELAVEKMSEESVSGRNTPSTETIQ